MATIHPFAALRPAPEAAARVSAVPYDVVTTAEARRLAAGNPLSFLHVSRPEIDMPEGADSHADDAYRMAAENFEALKRGAPLVTESRPSVYAYRLRVGDHEQTGVAACCSLAEYDRDVILRHERTRRDKEDDRTRHMIALSAQTGPVFLTYRDDDAVDALVQAAVRAAPLYDFEAEDGVKHTLWRMEPETAAALVQQFGRVPHFYIADGHHRAASAARARDHYRSAAGGRAGEFDFFLAVLFPASQVRILPYNRVVRELNGHTPEGVLAELAKRFRVAEGAAPSPARRGEIAMYLAGRWYGLSEPASSEAAGEAGQVGEPGKTGKAAGATGTLDVSVLQEQVLEPVFGIRDIRTDPRIDFVGGARGTEELVRLVDSGAAAAAFSLYPVSLDDLMSISDAGEIMPPKSTWFEPKLRDGLLVHTI